MSRVSTVGGERCLHSGLARGKRRIGVGGIALAAVWLVLAVPVGAARAANGLVQSQPVGSIACVRDVPAVIHGKHKCLGPGEYCSRAYEREYERYGFVCSTSYDPPRLRRE